jgi:hypothetical protein
MIKFGVVETDEDFFLVEDRRLSKCRGQQKAASLQVQCRDDLLSTM